MRKRNAFTLVELLVVVAIIALLVAILVPALTEAREQANRAVCAVNLHQIMLGMHMYYSDHSKIPPGWPDWGHPGGSWLTQSGWTMSFGGGNATGLGLLYHGGYAAVTDIYWCPSTAYPWIRFYTEVEQKERLADVSGTYGSQSSYIYRRRTGYKEMSGNEGQWSGTLDGKFGQFAHLITINDFSADLSAVTDMHMYPRDEVVPNRSLHKTGLNAAYWEGNVSWVNDPDPDYHTAWFVDGPRSSKPWNTFFWLADFPNQAENY